MSLKGFSIIEVLVSALLIAIIGGLLLQSMTGSIQAKQEVEKVSDRYHVVRQALNRMVREISMAYLSKHHNATLPVTDSLFQGDKSILLFTAFGHIAHQADAKQSDQRVIEYSLGTDPKTKSQAIFRRERLTQGTDFRSGGVKRLLCPYIKSLTFEYFNQTVDNFVPTWDSKGVVNKDTLPLRVKITLVATMDNDRDETFMTESEIFLKQPIWIK